MSKIMTPICLAISFSALAFAASIRTITADEVGNVREGLNLYYADCGFYPEKLEDILVPTRLDICDNGGGDAPLTPSQKNQEIIKKLQYTPLNYRSTFSKLTPQGFHDYNLSIKELSSED